MRIAGIDPESKEPITVVTKGTTIEAIEQGLDRPDIGPAGAQNPEQMRDPDFDEFSRSLQCPG